ncbi:hypothetical protein PAHAL_6G195200 [Panicum hallii]|uniref:Uncharacterized protein n=1 Tax=Panicum hallii TaxID=206008 RepID=A0A2T8IGX6_9POAL|nr:hypothetical protein PAHAL_6G195200 [Panicum hallii]
MPSGGYICRAAMELFQLYTHWLFGRNSSKSYLRKLLHLTPSCSFHQLFSCQHELHGVLDQVPMAAWPCPLQ